MSEKAPLILRIAAPLVALGALGAQGWSAYANAHVDVGQAEASTGVTDARVTKVDVPTDPNITVGSYGVNARAETTMRLEFSATAGLPDWLRDNLTSLKTTAVYNAAKSDGSTPPVVAESVVGFKATKFEKKVNFDVPLVKDLPTGQTPTETRITLNMPTDIFEVHSIVPRGNAINVNGGGLAFKRNAPATKLKELSVDMEWDWLPDDLPLNLKEDGVTLSQRLDNMAANMGIEAIDEVANTKCFATLLNQLPQGTVAPAAPNIQDTTQPTPSATATSTLPPFLAAIDKVMKKQAVDAYNQNNPGGGATEADVTINWPATFNLANVDVDQKKARKTYDELRAKLAEHGMNLTIDWPNMDDTSCVSSAGTSTLSERQSTIDDNANGGEKK